MVRGRRCVVLHDGTRLDHVLSEPLTALGNRTARQTGTEEELGHGDRRDADILPVFNCVEIERTALDLDQHARVEQEPSHRDHGSSSGAV